MTSFMDSRLRGFLDDYIGLMFLFLSCRHKNDYIVHTKYLRKNYSSNSDSWIGIQYLSGKCTPFCLLVLLLKEDQNSIFYQEIKRTMRFATKIWDQKFNQTSIEWFAAKKPFGTNEWNWWNWLPLCPGITLRYTLHCAKVKQCCLCNLIKLLLAIIVKVCYFFLITLYCIATQSSCIGWKVQIWFDRWLEQRW